MSTTFTTTNLPNCSSEINGSCVECNGGYSLTPNGDCLANCPNLAHCATCDDDGLHCTSCMEGFYPLPFGAGCSPSPFCPIMNCQQCDTKENVCDRCNDGYKVSKDGQCTRVYPLWFWIVIGSVGALVLALILYAIFHKGETQKEFGDKIRARVN